MRAHAEALGNLRNRITALSNLRDRITLELISKIARPHQGLLASNLGKKASTNLGAIQLPFTSAHTGPERFSRHGSRKTAEVWS